MPRSAPPTVCVFRAREGTWVGGERYHRKFARRIRRRTKARSCVRTRDPGPRAAVSPRHKFRRSLICPGYRRAESFLPRLSPSPEARSLPAFLFPPGTSPRIILFSASHRVARERSVPNPEVSGTRALPDSWTGSFLLSHSCAAPRSSPSARRAPSSGAAAATYRNLKIARMPCRRYLEL